MLANGGHTSVFGCAVRAGPGTRRSGNTPCHDHGAGVIAQSGCSVPPRAWRWAVSARGRALAAGDTDVAPHAGAGAHPPGFPALRTLLKRLKIAMPSPAG